MAMIKERGPLADRVICRDSSGGRDASREAPAPAESTNAEIRQRAYEVFVRRGGAPGDAVSDCLSADLELEARRILDS